MKPLPYIFFDAVGTLFRLTDSVGSRYSRIAATFGFHLDPAVTDAAFRTQFSTSPTPIYPNGPTELVDYWWWQRLVARVFAAAGEDPNRPEFSTCFDALFAFYGSAEAWQLFPETEESLHRLTEHGFGIGVLSNFDSRLHAILNEFDIRDFFSHVVVSSEFGAAKPNPQLFHAAAAHVDRKPDACILIGDDPARDRDGALASGFRCVHLIDRPTTTLKAVAESLISSDSR